LSRSNAGLLIIVFVMVAVLASPSPRGFAKEKQPEDGARQYQQKGPGHDQKIQPV
jgi:hypothetical protein